MFILVLFIFQCASVKFVKYVAIDCISLDVGEWEPEGSGECGARVWCPDLQHEGQWHHLVLVLNRAVLKNSSFSLYLDGKFMLLKFS